MAWTIFKWITALGLSISIIVDTCFVRNITPTTLIHLSALSILIQKEINDWVDATGKEVDDDDWNRPFHN